MTRASHQLTITAVLTAAVLLTGCQSGSSAEPLSLAGLTKTADAVPDDGADTCPLPYDMAEAAKKAGTGAPGGPGAERDMEAPTATAEGGKRAKPGDPLAVNPGVLISCTFHVGQNDVQVHTIATRDRDAINLLGPVVSSLASKSSGDTVGYLGKAGAADAGDVIGDGGAIASVRLELDGEGDAALLVGVSEADIATLTPEVIEGLAGALAQQLG
ncbi:hypothetical protein ABZ023_11530 [Streptomyces sp. NPDC006367]|uniref:hypothetical protein n=1 Tax=unclassified Streptomyces TaxID=2593676 RepID=UPI0033BCF514